MNYFEGCPTGAAALGTVVAGTDGNPWVMTIEGWKPVEAQEEIPVIPPLTIKQKNERDNLNPNPIVAICGQCGLQLMRVMGYVCTNTYCPIYPQIR